MLFLLYSFLSWTCTSERVDSKDRFILSQIVVKIISAGEQLHRVHQHSIGLGLQVEQCRLVHRAFGYIALLQKGDFLTQFIVERRRYEPVARDTQT